MQQTLFSQIKTLVWKNKLIKKRNLKGVFLELFVPISIILLLSALKTLTEASNEPGGWQGTTFIPFLTLPGTMPGLGQRLISLAVSNSQTSLSRLSNEDENRCKNGFQKEGRVHYNTSHPRAIPSECDGLLIPYIIAITPDTPFTRNIIAKTVTAWYPSIPLQNNITLPSMADFFFFFSSQKTMESYIRSKEYGESVSNPIVYAALVFDTVEDGPFGSLSYSIRMNSSTPTVPETNTDPIDTLQRDINTVSLEKYATMGFMTLQTLVARIVNCQPTFDNNGAVICLSETTAADNPVNNAGGVQQLEADTAFSNILEGTSILDLDADSLTSLLRPFRQAPQPLSNPTVLPFPTFPFVKNEFYEAVGSNLPLLFAITFLYTFGQLVAALVTEKESRVKELMKIMGMVETSIIMSWYITYGILYTIMSLILTAISLAGLFENSSGILLFLFYELFSISIISLAYGMSALFSRAKNASIVGMLFLFIITFIVTTLRPETSGSTKGIFCIFPTGAINFGFQLLAAFEGPSIGVTFDNVNESVDNISFGMVLIILFFSSILFTTLGWYLEQVVPQEFGSGRKPWYFPCLCSRDSKTKETLSTDATNSSFENGTTNEIMSERMMEPVSEELQEQEKDGRALMVLNLKKEFSDGKIAVNKLTLNCYQGQITCLLGHNGAGKSTTISILTGMLPPSAGQVYFGKLNLKQDLNEIRKELGICPQHDVLYKELSVIEHLQLYGAIKGISKQELNKAVMHQIAQVGLMEKMTVSSNELSGGMKRKLSLAIALLGDSKFVFLDECTSGMDPYSRRSTWEMLQNNRQGRVIVLTTHFMDEADILGDRIAIMAEGKLHVCGSSLFLKNKYGVGYILTIVLMQNISNDTITLLEERVLGSVNGSSVLSRVGQELSFQLPLDATSSFPKLFTTFDHEGQEVGVLEYGISVTTMEEVFIKVGEETARKEEIGHNISKIESVGNDYDEIELETNPTVASDASAATPTFRVQYGALLKKRFWNAKRDVSSFLYGVFIPLIILGGGLALIKNLGLASDEPPLIMSLDQLPQGSNTPFSFYCSPDNTICDDMFTPSSPFSSGNPISIPTSALGSVPIYTPGSSPVVFNVSYPSYVSDVQELSETLRFSQLLLEDNTDVMFGAYLIQGNVAENTFGYSLLINTTALHGAPIYKSNIDTAYYRYLARANGRTTLPTITLVSFPLPLTEKNQDFADNVNSLLSVVLMLFAFMFFPASLITFLVKEKNAHHNAKHQQLVSGVSLPAYWFSTLTWDYASYTVLFISTLILLNVFGVTSWDGDSDLANASTAVVILLLLYGFGTCASTYLISYLFDNHTTAQGVTVLFNFLTGPVLLLVSVLLSNIESTEKANDVLVYFYRLFPAFSLGNGLSRIIVARFDPFLAFKDADAFEFEYAGSEILTLLVVTPVILLMVIGIDYLNTFPSVRSKWNRDPSVKDEASLEEDIDVSNERMRIKDTDHNEDVVQIQELRKVYSGPKIAVKNLSFGIPQGECFGFLGINGAGKTSTLKMLTGDIVPTSGKATLGGFNILSQQLQLRKLIGYCPQFDALLENLTVSEHLELYARIKGLTGLAMTRAVDQLLDQLNLRPFTHNLSKTLSGGNKRKLSVAMALIGSPQVLFLDEPSTGMDPINRRFMWKVLSEISTQSKASSIILTTHSMEECEALCSRIGIMVGGALSCLGSIQHLKTRFGKGLTTELRMQRPAAATKEAFLSSYLQDKERLSREDILDVCTTLGMPERMMDIHSSHPTGWSLNAALLRDGSIASTLLADWWLNENTTMLLRVFLETEFEHVTLLEQQGNLFRYRLHATLEKLLPGRVFDVLEKNKETLHLENYSVTQTSLDQVFNQFASKQQQETGPVRGL